jgi:hypothetical protein
MYLEPAGSGGSAPAPTAGGCYGSRSDANAAAARAQTTDNATRARARSWAVIGIDCEFGYEICGAGDRLVWWGKAGRCDYNTGYEVRWYGDEWNDRVIGAAGMGACNRFVHFKDSGFRGDWVSCGNVLDLFAPPWSAYCDILPQGLYQETSSAQWVHCARPNQPSYECDGALSRPGGGDSAPPPPPTFQDPSWVLIDTSGNTDIFSIDSAGALREKWYTPGTGGWSGWLNLGAPNGTTLRGKPSVLVSQVTGNVEVYARDGAGNVQQKWYTPGAGGWSGWLNLGNPGPALTSDPVVIKDTAGNEDIFAIDSSGALQEKWYTPGTGGWSGWLNLGAPSGSTLRGKPWAMVSQVTGNLEVYARDSAGNVQQKWYTPSTGTWSGWANLGNPGAALTSDPVVIKDTAGNEDIFAIDSAGTFWEKWYTPGTGGWSGWLNLGAPG